jgi:type II secretory pathway pseudopilin PulG
MRLNIGGFTLLEILVASAIMVAVTTFAAVGINTLLDYKRSEGAKSKLAYGALQVLDEVEKNWENKSTSLGNLLINERAYPFQFQLDGPASGYPSLSFFVNFPDGPRAICYGLAPLPAAISGGSSEAVGLFKLILDADSSGAVVDNFSPEKDLYAAFSPTDMAKIANLVSDLAVFFEVHLAKFADDGLTLEYLNHDAQAIKMYAGKWTLGGSFPTDIVFVEITVGVLVKSQQGEYFSLGGDERRKFLEKNGIKLSRLLPWRI